MGLLPTPLEPSPRLGAELGLELLWKRDDFSGFEVSGNKIRKLEYLLAEAEAEGADTLVTAGGSPSSRATASSDGSAPRAWSWITAPSSARAAHRPLLVIRGISLAWRRMRNR